MLPILSILPDIRAGAEKLRRNQDPPVQSPPTGKDDVFADACIVMVDLATRLLGKAGIIPVSGKVPHSRAAYATGFVSFLAAALQATLRKEGVIIDIDRLAVQTGRQVFQSFSDDEWSVLNRMGVKAMSQMMDIIGRADQLDEWAQNTTLAFTGYIQAPNEHDLDRLTRQFVSLPFRVRVIQSSATDGQVNPATAQ